MTARSRITAGGALALTLAAAATVGCGRVGGLESPSAYAAQRKIDQDHTTGTDSRLPVGPYGGAHGPADRKWFRDHLVGGATLTDVTDSV